MANAPKKRRGVESVDSSMGNIEQADGNVGADDASDVERGPTSTDSRSIESITDDRGADPFSDERIERP